MLIRASSRTLVKVSKLEGEDAQPRYKKSPALRTVEALGVEAVEDVVDISFSPEVVLVLVTLLK